MSDGNGAEGWAGAMGEELTPTRLGTVETAEREGHGADVLNLRLVFTKLL